MRLVAALFAVVFSVSAVAAEIHYRELPPEAQQTLALIKAGGPFPYQRDATVFSNYQGILPKRGRGYYLEFTVKTPGARDRGARRIVAGGGMEFYYTEDHYSSFRRIVDP